MKHEEEFPILIAQDGPLKGQRWSLSRTLMIGRDPTWRGLVGLFFIFCSLAQRSLVG